MLQCLFCMTNKPFFQKGIEVVVRRWLQIRCCWKFRKFHWKTPLFESPFNKFVVFFLRPTVFLEKDSNTGVFLWNSMKFLGTTFLQNISGSYFWYNSISFSTWHTLHMLLQNINWNCWKCKCSLSQFQFVWIRNFLWICNNFHICEHETKNLWLHKYWLRNFEFQISNFNLRIPRIKNAWFPGYCFYMNSNIYR